MIKVAFQPTGLYRLLGIPMQKSVNTGLDAAAFLGEEIKILNRELSQAASYDDMIRIVSGFIDKRLENGRIKLSRAPRSRAKTASPGQTRTAFHVIQRRIKL